jgi:hypothetical protein
MRTSSPTYEVKKFDYECQCFFSALWSYNGIPQLQSLSGSGMNERLFGDSMAREGVPTDAGMGEPA